MDLVQPVYVPGPNQPSNDKQLAELIRSLRVLAPCAWAVYNGVTGTVLAAVNMTISKTGTGLHDALFNPPMKDVNYGMSGAVQSFGVHNVVSLDFASGPVSTTRFPFRTIGSDGTLYDSPYIVLTVHSK